MKRKLLERIRLKSLKPCLSQDGHLLQAKNIELDEDDDSTRGMFGERKEKKEIEPPVIEEPKKQKNKYLALLLAFIPFNLFGIYQFYTNGKKKGLKRLCTLNFVYVGYFMDWYDAVKNFLNSNNN